MLPLLSICQITDSSDLKLPSDIPYLEIYKGLKQEENLRYLATEQYLLLLEKDVIINQLLSEIEQLKEIRLLDEERFKLKDEIIEQHKKRRISIIGYSGFGYDFVNIRPQIGIGIGIELFRLK